MADIFTRMDMVKLLENKEILFVGDQNIRNIYKDFICLYQTSELMELDHIGRNLEESYLGDTLVMRQSMYKQRNYLERREFKANGTTFEFMFISQCLSNNFIQHLMDIMSYQVKAPDVIYMNSFLWDFNRWGPYPEVKYMESLNTLVQMLKQCLPKTTLFIWATTCPISGKPHDLPFLSQLPVVNATIYSDILEGNYVAAELFRFHGFDVIDNHYYLFKHGDRRSLDGVRYLPCAVRYLTYLLLTHIALTWDKTLPGRIDGIALHEEIARSKEKYSTEKTSNYWMGSETSNCGTQLRDKNNNTKRRFDGNSSGEVSEEEEDHEEEGKSSLRRTSSSLGGNESLYESLTEILEKTDDSADTETPSTERKPLLRVKATWEVLQEFGDNHCNGSAPPQQPLNTIIVNYGQLMENSLEVETVRPTNFGQLPRDFEQITSSENFSDNLDEYSHGEEIMNKENDGNSLNRKLMNHHMVIDRSSEIEEGEISDSSSQGNSFTREKPEKLSNVKCGVSESIENCDLVKVKSSEVIVEELEEGEIVDGDEKEMVEEVLEESLIAESWEEWKMIRMRKAIHLRSAKRKTGRRSYDPLSKSTPRRSGLIKQLKRKLIPPKCKRNYFNKRRTMITREIGTYSSSSSSSSLLFGYRKNDRDEQRILPLKTAYTTENNASTSGISWVADQWKRVLENESCESREVLSFWQGNVGEIEEQLEIERKCREAEIKNCDKLMLRFI